MEAMAEEKKSRRGFPCPHCRSRETTVLNTHTLADGTVRRRRQCSLCKGKFTTDEKRLGG